MDINFKNAFSDFEAEIEKMQQELQAYKAKPRHSNKFATFKQVRINIMQNLVDCFLQSELEDHFTKQAQLKQIIELKSKVFKLEAICLLHGVGGSIFTYLQMPDNSLGKLVQKCYKQSWRQTPLEILPGYENKPIKTAAKPCISFEALKTKAANEPGWYTEFKNEIAAKGV